MNDCQGICNLKTRLTTTFKTFLGDPPSSFDLRNVNGNNYVNQVQARKPRQIDMSQKGDLLNYNEYLLHFQSTNNIAEKSNSLNKDSIVLIKTSY